MCTVVCFNCHNEHNLLLLLTGAECDQQADDTYSRQAGEEGSSGNVQVDSVLHG